MSAHPEGRAVPTKEQIDAVLNEFSDTARSSTAVTQVTSVSLDEHAIARALIDARATIARLEGELQERTEDYHRACSTIAAMHAAAVGEITGPRRGAVEDVEDVRTRADAAERRVEAVKALVAVMEQMAAQAYEHWNADRDAKVGKILGALASNRPGYSITLDAARKAVTEADTALAAASGAADGAATTVAIRCGDCDACMTGRQCKRVAVPNA